MTREEFNKALEEANLTKKEFCTIIDLNYNTINNWGAPTITVPKWVKSWLENYIKAKDIDKIAEAVKPYIQV